MLVPQGLDVELLYDPPVPLPSIYAREMKAFTQVLNKNSLQHY